MDLASLLKETGSSVTSGLASDTAVAASRARFGANRLPEHKPNGFLHHLFEAFEDFTLQVLIFSAIVSVVFGVFVTQEPADMIQGGAIVLAVVLVSGVNSFQNWSKEREFQALATIKRDRPVQVVRGGREQRISVYEVVVGDLIKLSPGDSIPCDGILVEGEDIEVDQSKMTGESEPVMKSALAGGDATMLGSCVLLESTGAMLASAVGTATEIGQTVRTVETEEVTNTPLQDRLEDLAGQIGRLGTAAGALTATVLMVLFVAQHWSTWAVDVRAASESGGLLAGAAALPWAIILRHLTAYLIVAVTIIVVAVPEGLPLAVTISLAYSMRKMMKDNNLVRQLQACETMGSVTVICSDKTGTLTENRMKVVEAHAFGKTVQLGSAAMQAAAAAAVKQHSAVAAAVLSGDASAVAGLQHPLGAAISNQGAALRLAKAIALNSTADLDVTPARVEYIRNPSECALLLMTAVELGLSYAEVRSAAGAYLARRQFKKETKFMTSVYEQDSSGGSAGSSAGSGGPILYSKGAPEMVLARCSALQLPDGTAQALSGEMRSTLEANVEHMASRGLRIIAVSYRRLPSSFGGGRYAPSGNARGLAGAKEAWQAAFSQLDNEVEADMVLLGLFGIEDPLREGVPEAITQCQQSGIRVIMVTGDHRKTAESIARQAGILKSAQQAGSGAGSSSSSSSAPAAGLIMEGEQFRGLDEAQRQAACRRLAVLARSSPTDKHLLVDTLKSMGEVVGVTGDGTNDAPALRAADVGLAMGIAGTDMAKEASDIIIMDDRFSSIVASVRWGRSIKENIRKFLGFQLTINIVALTLTFITACSNGGSTEEFPLKPVQLLWVNLIMDSFAALALATEPPSEKLMQYPPQGKEEPLITPTMFKNMLGHAAFQTALLLWLSRAQSGAAFFGPGIVLGSEENLTLIFNTFIFLQIFNLFNCRAVRDEWNILAGFGESLIGQLVLIVILVTQVALVQLGGSIFQTVPLSAHQWLLCIGLGFFSIPVGYLLKLLPLAEDQLRDSLAREEPHAPSTPLYADSSDVRSVPGLRSASLAAAQAAAEAEGAGDKVTAAVSGEENAAGSASEAAPVSRKRRAVGGRN